MQLFIDDGVSSRGHRDNMMNNQFSTTAISSCPHPTYTQMTAFAYAKGFTKNTAADGVFAKMGSAASTTTVPTSQSQQCDEYQPKWMQILFKDAITAKKQFFGRGGLMTRGLDEYFTLNNYGARD